MNGCLVSPAGADGPDLPEPPEPGWQIPPDAPAAPSGQPCGGWRSKATIDAPDPNNAWPPTGERCIEPEIFKDDAEAILKHVEEALHKNAEGV